MVLHCSYNHILTCSLAHLPRPLISFITQDSFQSETMLPLFIAFSGSHLSRTYTHLLILFLWLLKSKRLTSLITHRFISVVHTRSIDSPVWAPIDSFLWFKKNPLIKLPGPLASDECLWLSLASNEFLWRIYRLASVDIFSSVTPPHTCHSFIPVTLPHTCQQFVSLALPSLR
jgi:hypothetical protein